jgi:hypothetical protein
MTSTAQHSTTAQQHNSTYIPPELDGLVRSVVVRRAVAGAVISVGGASSGPRLAAGEGSEGAALVIHDFSPRLLHLLLLLLRLLLLLKMSCHLCRLLIFLLRLLVIFLSSFLSFGGEDEAGRRCRGRSLQGRPVRPDHRTTHQLNTQQCAESRLQNLPALYFSNNPSFR